MSATFDLPHSGNITRVELPNGIIVLVYENHQVESVVISGSLEAGSLFETPAQNGLASLTAAALMRGTHRRDFDALHATLEDIGADLSLGAGYHTVGFGGRALAEDLPVLLDVLNDVLRAPAFPPGPVDNLRQQRLTEIKYSDDDTRYRAGLAFRQALYGPAHPYHYLTYGTRDTLPHLSAADLTAFHRQVYGPRGMILSVVGAVDTAAALALVREHLEDWTNPHQPALPALPPAVPPAEARHLYTGLAGKTQASIVMGTLGPSRFAPDYQAATLANSILGEFGMMGRIGSVIREELGLAYYAYSRLEGGPGPGAWSIAAGVAPENVALTIERALDEVRRLVTEPVSAADLADNLSYFTGRLPLRLESSAGIAATLQSMERYGLGLDYLLTYAERLHALTPDDLLQAAQHYLDPARFVVAVAGPNGSAPAD
jgi:zinc protease